MGANVRGDPVLQENIRLYEKLTSIQNRKPSVSVPFGHQNKKSLANSMGFQKRRNFGGGQSLKPSRKYASPLVDTRRNKKGVADLTRPILTRSKKQLLADNTPRVAHPNQKLTIAEQDR